jgi:Peptidase M16 inactive domain
VRAALVSAASACTSRRVLRYHWCRGGPWTDDGVFLQFFIEPLISVDGIDRERRAVDSEHSKNLQSDAWRQQQLWKSLADPSSNFSRFFTGNLETLGTRPEAAGVNVRDELVAFYEREYSANRMKLCVLGRESVEEMEAIVRRLFDSVPDKGAFLVPGIFQQSQLLGWLGTPLGAMGRSGKAFSLSMRRFTFRRLQDFPSTRRTRVSHTRSSAAAASSKCFPSKRATLCSCVGSSLPSTTSGPRPPMVFSGT